MTETEHSYCTGDPETCPVAQRAKEFDEVLAEVEAIDPAAAVERKLFQDIAGLCMMGLCPPLKDVEEISG